MRHRHPFNGLFPW